MKVELSVAHFLFLGVAVAVVLLGILYGIYRIVRRLRTRHGEIDARSNNDDDV